MNTPLGRLAIFSKANSQCFSLARVRERHPAIPDGHNLELVGDGRELGGGTKHLGQLEHDQKEDLEKRRH